MGLATARHFVEHGAKVIITGRRQKDLDEAVKIIGKNVEGVRGDISNLADFDRLHDHLEEKYGRVDILFANAGIGSRHPAPEPRLRGGRWPGEWRRAEKGAALRRRECAHGI